MENQWKTEKNKKKLIKYYCIECVWLHLCNMYGVWVYGICYMAYVVCEEHTYS